MFTTTRPAVSDLEASFARSGAVVPPELAKAFNRRTEANNRFANRPLPSADALAVAVLAAVEAGVDPASATDVRTILAAQHLAGQHGLAADVDAIMLEGIRATAQTAAPAVVAAWRKPFGKAADHLAGAHAVLGSIPLDDTAAVVKLGPAATAAWSAARDALAVVDSIVSGWLALCQLTTGTLPRKDRRLLIVADIDAATWFDDQLDHADVDAWSALGAGYDLKLCNVQDYARRIAAIEGETQHRSDAAAKRRAVAV